MTSRSDDRDLSRSAARAWLGVVLVVATAIRVHDLGAGLWFDEILTLADRASKSFGEIVTTYGTQNNHVLYSVAARASVGAFGESAWALRLPAVVFGVLSLAGTYAFGTRVTTRRQSLLASAVLAVSYHHVWFSQNARGYTALLAFTLLGSAWFLDLLRAEEKRRGLVAGYAIAMALAAYTHLTALVVIAAHAVAWIVRARGEPAATSRPGPAHGLVAACVLTAVLYAPMLSGVIDAIARPDPATQSIRAATRWTSAVWMARETVAGLARVAPGGALGLAAGAIVGSAGIVDHARRSRTATVVMVVPVLLVPAIALVAGHNLWPRFLFFAAGFAVIVGVHGVFVVAEALAPRASRALGTAVLAVAIVGLGVRMPVAWGAKQDYEAARRFVESHRGADDAVVTLAMATRPYEDDPGDWTGLVIDDPATLKRIESDHERTWAIWAFPTWVEATQPRVWDRIRKEYRSVAEFPGTVREGTVVVAVRG